MCTASYITRITISVSHRPIFTISGWDNFGGLDMSDWGLAQNPCIPVALVSDKYFPLLGGDPTLTAGQNRGQWSYDYSADPPASLTAKAVRITEWRKKIEVQMINTMAMSDAESEAAATA